MAGCGCYQAKAREAQSKIKILNADYRKFGQVKTRVSNCTSSIDSSASFFENLGAVLDKIVINQKKFDDGQCRQTAADIGTVKDEINNVVGQIESGMAIIDKEKMKQQRIINNVFFCSSCAEKSNTRQNMTR